MQIIGSGATKGLSHGEILAEGALAPWANTQ